MSYILRKPGILIPKIVDKISTFLAYDKSLIVVDDDRIIVDIPKTGSSFIKSALIASGRCIYSRGPSYPHSAVFIRPCPFSNDLSSYKIFAFVRDPLQRFCSVYREKVLCNAYNKGRWSPRQNSLFSLPHRMDSSLLLRELISLPLHNVDKHLLPQYCFFKKFITLPNLTLLPSSCISDFVSSFVPSGVTIPVSSALKTDPSLFGPNNLDSSSLQQLRIYYASDLECYRIAIDAWQSYC